MITKLLEAKLIDAISSALGDSSPSLPKHQIFGTWQPSAANTLRNSEDADTVAVIAVALAMPYSPTFSSPEVTFSGAIALTVRLELDPDGTNLVAFAEKLETLFRSWQSATYQQPFTVLDVTGLSVDEVSIGQSQPPAYNLQKSTVSLSLPITLKGSYTQ